MQDLFSNIDISFYLVGFLLIAIVVSIVMVVGFWRNRSQMPRVFFILLITVHGTLALALIIALLWILISGLL